MVLHGNGKRHQIVYDGNKYNLIDTLTNLPLVTLSKSGWNLDSEIVFKRYCDRWNSGASLRPQSVIGDV